MAWLPRNPFFNAGTTVFEAAADAFGINQGIQLFGYIVVVVGNKFWMSALLFH